MEKRSENPIGPTALSGDLYPLSNVKHLWFKNYLVGKTRWWGGRGQGVERKAERPGEGKEKTKAGGEKQKLNSKTHPAPT